MSEPNQTRKLCENKRNNLRSDCLVLSDTRFIFFFNKHIIMNRSIPTAANIHSAIDGSTILLNPFLHEYS